MQLELKGTGVPLAIPFHRHGTIDFSAMGRLVESVIKGGADYIAVLSNFSESNTLSNDEKSAVLDFTLDIVADRVPLIAGISGNNTQILIDYLKKSTPRGLKAIIPFCPYIAKVKQKGVFYHYKEISSVSQVPVIIYNTLHNGNNLIEAKTVTELARQYKNLLGYLEDSPSLNNIFGIIDQKPENFKIIMADDMHMIPALSMGAHSLMPVIANAYPTLVREIFQMGILNDFENARKVFRFLLPLIKIMQEDDKLSAVKAILDIHGICANNLRLPMIKLKKNLLYQLQDILHETEINYHSA